MNGISAICMNQKDMPLNISVLSKGLRIWAEI